MYRLLIVEDEISIANGIANSLPWNEWGFEICGVCGNGVEALEKIAADTPDIVLSDIRMPKMNGLELMQYLNREYPDIRIIILSGYSDFEYLQTSIQNGVCEYLLKPTDIDEFESVFRRMKERLDRENEQKKSMEAAKRLKEQEKFNALIRGYGYDEERMEQELYGGEEGSFGVLFVYPDDVKMDDKKEYYALGNRVADALEKIRCIEQLRGKFFFNYEDVITGVLFLTPEQEETLGSCTEKMISYVQENTGIGVSIGVSDFYIDYQMLPQCYQQAKCCARQKMFSEKSHLVMWYKEMQEADFDYYTITFDFDRIMEEILEQDQEKTAAELEKTLSVFRNRVISDYDYINRLCLELLFNISRRLLRRSVQMEKVMNELGCTYSDIYKQDTLEDKKAFLLRIFMKAAEDCRAMKGESRKRSSLAAAIREIVDSEYDSNRMSLEYVAGRVNKNTAYISKIFKNEFECNFSDYVTRKRLEKSRELLKDPALKIYEISESLGWADVSNYIKVFKKRYGMSPNEYRNMNGGTRTD